MGYPIRVVTQHPPKGKAINEVVYCTLHWQIEVVPVSGSTVPDTFIAEHL